MDQLLIGLGIGSVVFTTGFLLAFGAFAGIKASSYVFGALSVKSEHNTNVYFKD